MHLGDLSNLKTHLFKKRWVFCFLLLLLWGLGKLVPALALKERYRTSQAVYSKEGRLLRLTLSNDQKYRLWVPLNEIAAPIVESFLFSEDKYFYEHWGVNPFSLLRASWQTYFSQIRRRGASTITMQVARMIYRTDSRSISGKLIQIGQGLWLDYRYSKKEILEAYLNLVPMGGNIEGVGAASLIFFNKAAKNVDWVEGMTMAVIPQNPVKRTLLRSQLEETYKARQRLFNGLKEKLKLTDLRLSEYELVQAKLRDLPFLAPHYIREVLAREPIQSIIQGTLNFRLQSSLEKRVKQYVEAKRSMGVENASLVLINWQTSEVISWIGSADFFNAKILGQVDGVTAIRSPGSTLKPFIFGLAVEEGLIHAGTLLKDSPKSFGSYDPENFDGEFKGPLSAEAALNLSRNLPAVELVSKLKERDFYQFLLDVGVGIPRNKDFYGHSIALGGFELSLLELVEMYAMLARGGVNIKGRLSQNELAKRNELKLKSVMRSEAAFIVQEMLSKATLSSHRYRQLNRLNSLPVSWKTGTSSGYRDAWTVGTFGPYALGLWIGNFSGEGNKSFVGREIAAPLFFDLIDVIRLNTKMDEQAQLAWLPPMGVKKIPVCTISGQIPTAICPHHTQVSFIPGVSPIASCNIHRQVWLSKKNGSLSCQPNPEKDIPVVFEYWPSDILEIFAQAGLARRRAPQLENECNGKFARNVFGSNPEIISPREQVVYSLQSHKKSEKIPLSANLDGSAREIFWFINSQLIGKSLSGKIFFWRPRVGQFQLTAIDDLGRSSSRKVEVRYVD